MTTEEKQEMASLYALGALDPTDSMQLEALASKDEELAGLMNESGDLVGEMLLADAPTLQDPPQHVKSCILRALEDTPEIFSSFGTLVASENEAVVVADRQGLIQWVNSAFTQLCGYEFSELRGRKPGKMLQGPLTDPQAVDALRSAVRDGKPHIQEIVNYHKNGSAYRVNIALSPILAADGDIRGYVAIEKEISPDDLIVA